MPSITRRVKQCVRPVFVNGDKVVIRWIFHFEWLDGTVTHMEELACQRWEGERIAEETFFYDPAQRIPRIAAYTVNPTLKPTPAIVLRQQFVGAPDELFALLCSNVQWDERLRARKTASFGESYNYSGMTYPKVRMLAELEPVCARIQSELGFLPNNCLLNYYPDGQSSMGFHSDATEELAEGTGVAIASLGAERQIVFRHKQDRSHEVSYRLPGGSLLYMPKELQFDWLHAIPKAPGAGPRISLTFRLIAKASLAEAEHKGL